MRIIACASNIDPIAGRRALYKNQLYAANTVNREMLIIVRWKKRVNYRTIPTRLPTDSFHKIYKISPHLRYTPFPSPHSEIFRRWRSAKISIKPERIGGGRRAREKESDENGKAIVIKVNLSSPLSYWLSIVLFSIILSLIIKYD